MSATAGRRHKEHEEEEHENEERWLVSFADMMTLLFCLFMVLFAISSVNTSKFESLQKSLQEAFSGKVLPGGTAVMQTGADSKGKESPEVTSPPTVVSTMSMASVPNTAEGNAEEQQLQALKRRVDAAAKDMGLKDKIQAQVADRGLVVRLRTDGVFFAPGSAALQPAAAPIVGRLGRLIAGEGDHPLIVEGYTDSNPISNAQYPSNWELSGARASSVMRALIAGGMKMNGERSVRGFAENHPIEPNTTPAGRSANRRVEIVLTRLHRRSP